ncbi:unnamed protein product, partial [Prunus brigantina]
INYLQYPTLPSEKRVRIMALNYLVWNGDLVRKSKDEVLLRCLGKKEYMKVMGETHEGICEAHQGGRKIIAHQHNLVGEDYSQAMLLELEGLDASRIDTLNKLLAGK